MIEFTPTPIVVEHMARNGFTLSDMVGIIPAMLSEHDPRPAVEQLNEGYAHGGGWHEFQGFKLVANTLDDAKLVYPGDPPIRAIAYASLRDERIVLFESSWVAVFPADLSSLSVSRMD